MEKIGHMLGAGGKGIYWTFLVSVFGLAQLWIIIGYQLFNDASKVSVYYMAKDGALLFFALAVTMSVTMDFWFEPKVSNKSNLAKATTFVFTPIAVMGFVIGAYSIIMFGAPEKSPDLVCALSIGAITLSLLFAMVGKAYIFFCSQRNSQG